jgi:exosortase A-associated hydrolase 2
MPLPSHAPPEPFFLASAQGERFCLYHAAQGVCRGALVYVHPFAEEMNKTRRMAALGARALAAHGYAVLQIDLHGCGDSDGDFGEARWAQWKADLAVAISALQERSGQPAGLWGLRAGALLALDYARSQPVQQLLLWQPVTDGPGFLTQFLRLRLASAMLDQGAAGGTTASLRATLADGEPLEIAGYLLAPDMASALDALGSADLAPNCPTDWLEIVAAPERPVPPGAARLAASWQLAPFAVAGPSFWATQEIAECPALIAATITALEARHAA